MKISEIDPQAIIVLAIMVIGALRWILENIKKSRGDQEHGEQPESEFEELYEEARREIQSRQNRAPEAELRPPPVPHVHERPPVVVTPVRPTATRPPEQAPPPLPGWKPAKRPVLSPAQKAAAARFQQQSARQRSSSRRSSGSRIQRLLRTPGSARDAIVLSEILGPPKGAT